jgi:hypothetical protein
MRAAARVLAGAMLAVVALQVGALPSASAGTYQVFPCHGKSDDLSFVTFPATAFRIANSCDQPLAGVNLESIPNRGTSRENRVRWEISRPADTSFREVSMNADFTGAWNTTSLTWQASGGADILERAGQGGTRNPSGGPISYIASATPGPGRIVPGSSSFTMEIACTQSSCSGGPTVGFFADDIEVVLEDTQAPTIEKLSGTLLAPGTQQGLRGLAFTEHDRGAGVFSSEVLIGGAVVSNADRTNNGQCVLPFEFLQPCSRDSSQSRLIDTALGPDGTQPLTIRVCDATFLCLNQVVGNVTIKNAPTNSIAPTVTGVAEVGATLSSETGGWTTPASSTIGFSRQWLRCPASVTAASEAGRCTPIAAAIGTQYVPVKADVGQRAMLQVTATLTAAGHASATAASAPSDIVADLPTPPAPPDPLPVPGPAPTDRPAPTAAGAPPIAAPGNPPQTRLKKRPRKKTALTATRFSFVSDQAGARFECKLDKRPFRSCGSTFKKKLKPGAHVFRVRAVNSAGQVDATPAVFRWKIKPPAR